MDPEDQAEIKRLSALLEEACHRSRRSRRDLERALGVGHGYLNHLFAGRMDLKLRHVFQILREVKLDADQFFRDAFALPEGDSAPAPPARRPAAPVHGARSVDRDLFKNLLREIVREELEEMATAAGRAPDDLPEEELSRKKSR